MRHPTLPATDVDLGLGGHVVEAAGQQRAPLGGKEGQHAWGWGGRQCLCVRNRLERLLGVGSEGSGSLADGASQRTQRSVRSGRIVRGGLGGASWHRHAQQAAAVSKVALGRGQLDQHGHVFGGDRQQRAAVGDVHEQGSRRLHRVAAGDGQAGAVCAREGGELWSATRGAVGFRGALSGQGAGAGAMAAGMQPQLLSSAPPLLPCQPQAAPHDQLPSCQPPPSAPAAISLRAATCF